MTRMRLRIAASLMAGIVLYTVAWYAMAALIEARVIEQLAAEQAHGVTIAAARHHKSGYPFAFDVTLEDVTLTGTSGLTITSPRLDMGASLTSVTRASISARRGMVVGVAATGTRPLVEAEAADVTGTVHFGLDGLRDADLALTGMTIAGPAPADKPVTIASLVLHLDRPETPPADATQPGAHVTITASQIVLQGKALPALGNTVARVALDATIMGTPPLLTQESLAAWRDAGGIVQVTELSAAWGPLTCDLNGTLALDNEFQPLASTSAKITGFAETVDALAASGAIKGRNAGLIKMGLGVIARPDGPDGAPMLTVPLTIQNRTLYLAHFKIAPVPEVRLF